MAVYNDIWLGPSGSPQLLTPYGRKLRESYNEIARSERTADGTLVKDIKAQKKTFTITYDFIENSNLVAIAALFELEDELVLTVKRPDASTDDYTVLLQPFEHERATLAPGTTYWEGVTLVMDEV